MGDELADLQERLWAERTAGSERRVLLVLQGMDTSGKGGVLRHTDRPHRPAGRADHQLQGAHRRGAGARLPVADREGPAGGRLRRRLRPLPLRGRPDRQGARVRRPRRDRAPLRRHQRLRGPARRTRASRSSSACSTSAPTSRRPGCRSGSTTRRSTGSTTPATSTSARCWPAYREAYEIALERTNTEVAPWHVVPGGQEVVPQPGGRPAAARHAARPRPAVAGRRLRRRGGEARLAEESPVP